MIRLNRFYAYGYKRSINSLHGDKGTYYYIGKGTGDRAYRKSKGEIGRPIDDRNIVIIAADITETDAYQLEMLLIFLYGRIDTGTGILRNKTDGGGGTSGFIINDNQKIALDKGRYDPIARAKMIAKCKGKKRSIETKLRIALAMTGIKRGPYKRQKPNIGK